MTSGSFCLRFTLS